MPVQTIFSERGPVVASVPLFPIGLAWDIATSLRFISSSVSRIQTRQLTRMRPLLWRVVDYGRFEALNCKVGSAES